MATRKVYRNNEFITIEKFVLNKGLSYGAIGFYVEILGKGQIDTNSFNNDQFAYYRELLSSGLVVVDK